MTLAKKLLDEKSRDYMSARRVVKEYEALTRGILRGTASVPFQGTTDDFLQVTFSPQYINKTSAHIHILLLDVLVEEVHLMGEKQSLAFGRLHSNCKARWINYRSLFN